MLGHSIPVDRRRSGGHSTPQPRALSALPVGSLGCGERAEQRFALYRYSPNGRRPSQDVLCFYDEASAETWLNRAATIVRAADSELVCSQNQRPALERAALERYREAYDLLERNAVARASIDGLFAPEAPIRLSESLPARAYPMPSASPSDSSGHIDIAFEITKYGRAQRIDIVDATPNCTDEEKHNLFLFVRDGLYRPRAANGAIADGSRVVWRYYWRDSFYDELYWGDRHFL